MRRYETIFIIDPDLSDEDRTSLFEKLNLLFPQLNGFLVATEAWGVQKLAYEIKKKVRGYYVRLDYCGTGPLVNEIERLFRIDDRVLKYMTLALEQDVDLERVKEEQAQAKAKEEKAVLQEQSQPAEKIPEASEPAGFEDETNDTESDEEE